MIKSIVAIILILLIVPYISGCCGDTPVPQHKSEYKFKAGNTVNITGFYSNCTGVVVGALSYKGNRYKVKVDCEHISTYIDEWFDEDQLTLKEN